MWIFSSCQDLRDSQMTISIWNVKYRISLKDMKIQKKSIDRNLYLNKLFEFEFFSLYLMYFIIIITTIILLLLLLMMLLFWNNIFIYLVYKYHETCLSIKHNINRKKQGFVLILFFLLQYFEILIHLVRSWQIIWSNTMLGVWPSKSYFSKRIIHVFCLLKGY
jgi:hypothetical protein